MTRVADARTTREADIHDGLAAEIRADDPAMRAAAPNDPLWRVYREAASLLHELERAAGSDGIALASICIAILTAHIDPLRRAIEAVKAREGV